MLQLCVCFCLILACAGGDVQHTSSTENDPWTTVQCRPVFPYRDGWLGADAAYSVRLDATRSLWLFGDTFVANVDGAARQDATMVRNSIGLSSCDAAHGWHVDYYWSEANVGGPRAFFDSESDESWYWPLDGFALGDSVYVAMAVMRDRPDGGLFSFESTGVRLVRISGVAESPGHWSLGYRDLSFGTNALPGSTIVPLDDHVYLFTLYDDPAEQARHMILARLPFEGLDEPAANLEYLAQDRTWKPGLEGRDALAVIETGHSEMSVRYHEGTRKWLAVADGGFLSDRVMLRTAEALAGPWSEWRPVHRFAEMTPDNPRYDEETWCYAAKEQTQFSEAHRILVTYNCNSSDLHKQLRNTDIYRPQTVIVDLDDVW